MHRLKGKEGPKLLGSDLLAEVISPRLSPATRDFSGARKWAAMLPGLSLGKLQGSRAPEMHSMDLAPRHSPGICCTPSSGEQLLRQSRLGCSAQQVLLGAPPYPIWQEGHGRLQSTGEHMAQGYA